MKKNHLMIIVCILTVGFISGCSKTFNKTFGGSGEEVARSAQQTIDGGYILAGFTDSYGAGSRDVWLIKTDANGVEQWDKTFGGLDDDCAHSVQQTKDRGYILAGMTRSNGAGSKDVWLIKTDANGNEQWKKPFGGSDEDVANSVQQTKDGGYILAGMTRSYGAGITSDVWLIKTNASGETCDYSGDGNCYENESKWVKTFGGSGEDFAWSVQQTKDGGYILAGYIGSSNLWLIKTDADGVEQWNKTFGSSGWNAATSVHQTKDGGYILAGGTESYGAGGVDVWLIKTDAEGNAPATPTP